MVRAYRADPVAPDVVDELIDLARRSPSAGNTQGVHFVVLEGREQTATYWNTTLPAEKRASFPWPRLLEAPVLVLPCGDERAYVKRYGEADKAHTGLGASADAWAMPYWHIDTAMATMTLLHAAVDRGLGALFFGIFDHEEAVAALTNLPAGVRPIGAVAIGWPDPDEDRPSRSTTRGRRPLSEVLHRGGWSSEASTEGLA